MVCTVLTGILLIAILAKICPMTWNAAIGHVCASIARVGFFSLEPERPDPSIPKDIDLECSDDLDPRRPPPALAPNTPIIWDANHFHACAMPNILDPSVKSQQYPATKKN